MQLFSADATMCVFFLNIYFFFDLKKLKKNPTKILIFSPIAVQMAQTEELIFQNVAYRASRKKYVDM